MATYTGTVIDGANAMLFVFTPGLCQVNYERQWWQDGILSIMLSVMVNRNATWVVENAFLIVFYCTVSCVIY